MIVYHVTPLISIIEVSNATMVVFYSHNSEVAVHRMHDLNMQSIIYHGRFDMHGRRLMPAYGMPVKEETVRNKIKRALLTFFKSIW
jgi:hypothetical protein